jgi:hypothetical protein
VIIPLLVLSIMQVRPAHRTGEVVELTFRLQRARDAEYVFAFSLKRQITLMTGGIVEMARISQRGQL